MKEILEKAQNGTISALRKPSRFIEFIERSTPDVFNRAKLVDRLPLLAASGALIEDIGFPNLRLDDRERAIKSVADYSLWKIIPKNILAILEWQGMERQAAQSKMFLSLSKLPEPIFENVEKSIDGFVEDCFLKVESTVAEPQEGVEKILSVDGLNEELGKLLIKRQNALVRFSDVPRVYWPTIVEEQKYVIDWINFDELLVATGDTSELAPIFRSDTVTTELAKNRKKIRESFFDFLVNFEDMSLANYQRLISPELGIISEFPTAIEPKKKLHLINSGMIELSENSRVWLQGQPALRVALIEEQFTTFEEIKDWSSRRKNSRDFSNQKSRQTRKGDYS